MSSPAMQSYRRFWSEASVTSAALRTFRWLFFMIVALDAWRQIEHAPRYGAGDFNVAHFGILDALLPTPSRAMMLAVFVLQAYVAARIALGHASRRAMITMAALFSFGYFVSQLDSYQHHYLIALALMISCFVPWNNTEKQTKHWSIRLLLIQISILYFWAAISKMDPVWTSGQTLSTQVGADWARDVIQNMFGDPVGTGDYGGWATASKLVIATELFLAVAIHVRILRLVACVVGVVFHLSVEFSGFQIGLFSYFMVATYVLVLPDSIVLWIVKMTAPRSPRTTLRQRAIELTNKTGAIGWGIGVVAILAGSAVLFALPVPATAIAIITIGLAAVIGGHTPIRIGVGHVLACLLVLGMSGITDSARNYYRYWGGSARRFGDLDTAVASYKRVIEIAPDWPQGHTSLGNLYRRQKDFENSLDQFKKARWLASDDFRPHLGLALTYNDMGDGGNAYAAAVEALKYKPGNRQATTLRDRYQAEFGSQ